MEENFSRPAGGDTPEHAPDLPAPSSKPAAPEGSRSRHRWRLPAALLLLCLFGAALWFGCTEVRYRAALGEMELAQYTEAEEHFAALGSYKDAAALCAEAGKLLIYAEADDCFSDEDYQRALQLFRSLGSFRDAPARADEANSALHYQRAEELFAQGDYALAENSFRSLGGFRDAWQRAEEMAAYGRTERQYESVEEVFSSGQLFSAFDMLKRLEIPDFPPAVSLRDDILRTVVSLYHTAVEEGDRLTALLHLDFLDSAAYAQTDRLREALSGSLTPEVGYISSLTTQAPATFNLQTTVEELAAVCLDMFLTGDTRRTLSAKGGTGPYTEAALDAILERAGDGYDLAVEWLPAYGSIYQDFYVNVSYQNYRPTSLTLQIDRSNPYGDKELRGHVDTVDAFCYHSLLKLSQAGLLSDEMTHRQKARIIYDWVCYYLTYDQTKDIHNAALAIAETTGVCESYASLYNWMCNLAGIPSYGQIGISNGEKHIWSVQLDEDGSIFYTDPTWGDDIDLLFNEQMPVPHPSVEDFIACFFRIRQLSQFGIYEERVRVCDLYDQWSDDGYFWQAELWSSHDAHRTAQSIIHGAHR